MTKVGLGIAMDSRTVTRPRKRPPNWRIFVQQPPKHWLGRILRIYLLDSFGASEKIRNRNHQPLCLHTECWSHSSHSLAFCPRDLQNHSWSPMENPLSIQCLSPAPPVLQRPILALNQLEFRHHMPNILYENHKNLMAMKYHEIGWNSMVSPISTYNIL